MRVKKFMVIGFTIVAFIAVMTIALFGFKENKVETPTNPHAPVNYISQESTEHFFIVPDNETPCDYHLSDKK